jgi:two-component system nitrate/nitrite response regulator NarL
MRTSPALMAMDAHAENATHDAGAIIRNLTALIENLGHERDSLQPPEFHAEEILVDTEVDGSRYLLVRMRRSGSGRIQLSPREQEIVRMVAKGHPNKVIADVLNISSWTVCTHLRRIFAKLGVGSRAAMVAQLPELGVLGSEHRVPFNR